MTTELHPLGFFLPENTRLLMLGSFPPPKARWSMDFYYPNIQNDMWRILWLDFLWEQGCVPARQEGVQRGEGEGFLPGEGDRDR